jgi:hypothetical protein
MEISNKRKQLKRDADREAMTRIEESARTEAQFKDVVERWDKLDKNRERRERYNEIPREEELLNWESPERMKDEFPTKEAMKITHGRKIIPKPFTHIWWRQMWRGDFLDVIYSCPYQMHLMTSDFPISGLAEDLDANRKEILYHRAILLWSPQRIADMRDQTDRNIRKVYNKMMDDVRYELFYYLYWRYKKRLPITTTDKAFVIASVKDYGEQGKLEVDWELNKEDIVDSGDSVM